ncbi:MAG: hypothetical protein A2Z66_14715 [Chloroflexi bacterium RBG_13_66_10]|nr:MAG: hypothetical protein A2Z66_14715 [Chloroflexi bacterium RBG_13_66_10]
MGDAGPTPTLSQPEIGLGNSTAQFHPDLHEDRGGQDRLKARGRAQATARDREILFMEFGAEGQTLVLPCCYHLCAKNPGEGLEP